MPCCLFKKTAACRMATCTEAQGVRCCSICPYRKKCHSRCEIQEQMAAERKASPETQSEGEQLKLEV
jgi:hypothetical protein